MNNLSLKANTIFKLDNLSALRIAGTDAQEFLQGQLSNDISKLKPLDVQLSSLNSPQGRVIAILRVLRDAEGFLIFLPTWQLEAVQQRLARYVLRSQVTISPAMNHFAYGGAADNSAFATLTDVSKLLLPDNLLECFANLSKVSELQRLSEIKKENGIDTWQSVRIQAGIPEITSSTTEKFVAQMLNLDCLGGISFEKGCYTGQEIIARTQHRGRIKRRTYIGRCDEVLSREEKLVSSAGTKHGDLLEVSVIENKSLFLAVINSEQASEKLFVGDKSGAEVVCLPPSYLSN